MKYRLVIDKNADEEIIAIVHSPSALTQQIENLISNYAGTDSILAYREDEMRKLSFSEIECITILDRKVIAIDRSGVHYRIQQRLRDLESILLIIEKKVDIQLLDISQVYRGIFTLSALAFLAGGMNFIYQVERLPLISAIIIHGSVLYLGYLVTYLINGWLEWTCTQILVFSMIFILSYLLIWTVIYTCIRRKTVRINAILEQNQHKLDDMQTGRHGSGLSD